MSVKASTLKAVDDLIERYPALSTCKDDLVAAVEAICESYRAGHKLIACGNGGSASDAEHIVGELMKGFLLPRKLDKKMEERFRQVCPDSADYFMAAADGDFFYHSPHLAIADKCYLHCLCF